MKFNLVIPAYNCENYIHACLRSVVKQDDENYQALVIDDSSTDDTPNIIKRFEDEYDVINGFYNDENYGVIRNIWWGIENACEDDEEVIGLMGGDDWLANNEAISTVRERYESTDCLLTYGGYIRYPSDITPGHHQGGYSQETIEENSFRDEVLKMTHFQTFKYKLWKEIDVEDLKDRDGNFYEAGGDLAYMFPLLEMAGNRIEFISDLMYVYNFDNPLNDHKVNRSEQLQNEKEIRSKPKYKRREFE